MACAAAAAVSGVVCGSASAQIVFQDNFDGHPDGDTASVWQGGTPNDPGNGDADPVATIGSWGPITEPAPWYTQVSTATNGPTTGPAGGIGKYLTMMRNNEGVPNDVRGALSAPATNQLSMDFQIALTTVPANQGEIQFFVRGTNGNPFVPTGFAILPVYVNFTPAGGVNVNGTTSPGVFTAGGYETVHMDFDIATQMVSVAVNGVSAPGMTKSFLEPASSIDQFAFYVVDTGVAGIDNVSATLVPEPGSALLALGVPALLAGGRRGRGRLLSSNGPRSGVAARRPVGPAGGRAAFTGGKSCPDVTVARSRSSNCSS
jgi:hypothetical protein